MTSSAARHVQVSDPVGWRIRRRSISLRRCRCSSAAASQTSAAGREGQDGATHSSPWCCPSRSQLRTADQQTSACDCGHHGPQQRRRRLERLERLGEAGGEVRQPRRQCWPAMRNERQYEAARLCTASGAGRWPGRDSGAASSHVCGGLRAAAVGHRRTMAAELGWLGFVLSGPVVGRLNSRS